MQLMDWDDVRHFLEVVDAGSINQAAQRLGVNQTTVSRRIKSLEKHLGKNLFDRSGHGWVITPVGEQLVISAKKMAEEAHTLERQAISDSQELRGLLRITVADVCTQRLLMPALNLFTTQYPDVDLEIIATSSELNLAAREADIALRTTNTPPQNLVGNKIAKLAYAIYGSKEMSQKIKVTPNGENIACITWLGDGHSRPDWIEKNFTKTRRIYRTSELGLMLQMVQQGLGIAQMPCVFCDAEPALVKIPASFIEAGWDLWVLSHVDLRTTARVRIFRDFLVTELEKQKNLIEGISSKTN